MPKFFQKLKKQISKNSAESEQLPSPAVTTSSVATQSEPLPTSFHLDGLLNSSSPPPNEGLRTQRSEGCEEVDGVAILSAQPPLEERGMVWPCNSLSELTQPLCLPPPLVPSPPLTLSRSPTPARHTSHDSRGLPLTRDQLDPTPTHSTPSPFFRSVSCDGQKISYSLHSPSPIKNGSSMPKPAVSEVVGDGGQQLKHENEEKTEEEHCRKALQALELREKKLMTEVADLRAELRASCGSQSTSPHPEAVVADLEESLRKAEEAMQAGQGERYELREAVYQMREELVALRRSNSLLARRKQQWMEVASQTKMVLEENRNLMSQHKAQQLIIAGLQRQLHSRVAELERDLAQTVEAKRSMETQLRQMTDSHSHLLHRISALLGVSVSSESDHLASLLERYVSGQSRELATFQSQIASLEREKKVLRGKVDEARAVTRRLEGELCEVQRVVQGGEESVARLRGQLEEVQEREEATQLQLAHAIAQVDKAMSERDAYARIARRWQRVKETEGERETARALDEARQQLQLQAAEHRVQRKRYKTEIHRLRSLVAQESCVGRR